jgi:hypothetical protein
MRALGRIVVLLAAFLGGLAGSQLPEFAQQYRQRLGGALAELHGVVEQFDLDASRNHLTREAALGTYDKAQEPFLRDRGQSMAGALSRYERLFQQKVRIEAAPTLLRPVVVLNQPDGSLLKGAWSDFELGVPITTAGFVWAGIGFLLLGGIVSLVRQLGGIARRRGRRRQVTA